MSRHSVLPPASAARRMACPGSRALEAQYPGTESESSIEGKRAHEQVERILRNTGGGVDLNDEVIEHAYLYTDEILRLAGSFDSLHIEERVSIKTIHPSCWGTPDCWWIDKNELFLFDFKYGFKYVEVFENWQLIEYASGILDLPQASSVNTITFCIVQPRSYHRDGPIRYWRITRANLDGYFNRLKAAELLSLQPQALCNPSPGCTYCSARHVCKSLQQASMTAVENSLINTPEELTPESVSNELRLLEHHSELINARITGLQEQAKAYIRSGRLVPSYRLEPSAARDKWTLPAEQIVQWGNIFNIDLAKPLESITPRQAIKAGMPESVVNKMFYVPKGTLKLIRETEKDIRKKFTID